MVSQYTAVAVMVVAACLAVGVRAGEDVFAVESGISSSWDDPISWSRGFEPCAGDTVVLDPAQDHFITVDDSNNWVMAIEMPLADGDTGIIFEEGENGISGFYFEDGDGCTGMPTPAPSASPATSEPTPAPSASPATSEPTPALSTSPATSEPTTTAMPPTTAMTMEQVCAAILCPADCGDSDAETRDGIAGCGWSRGSGGCIYGGRTTGSELNLPCNTAPPVAPPTTAEPTVPPTMPVSGTPQTCEEIMCPADCNPDAIPGTVCGWSRKDGASECREGGRTTGTELLLPCNSVTGTATSPPAVATEATVSCADIACAYLCFDSCGWSRNSGTCQPGGRTSGSELSDNLALPGYVADSAARTCTPV